MTMFVTRASVMALAMTAAMFVAAPGTAATCIGNCGTWTPGSPVDGVVGPAPTNNGNGTGAYDWVSTRGGVLGAARIEGFSGLATNGSELLSDSFFAAAGSTVTFWFNYVTSDGSDFADYAFAQLQSADTGTVKANLFTARTKPSGTIVPGTDLPDVEARLTPGAVPIKPGGPVWSPLGSDSGNCFSSGCGHTGWVLSEYVVQDAGVYQLRFGASNWSDTAFDSGLAFSGLLLDGNVIGDGSSPDNPLLPNGEVTPDGGFVFNFTPTPNVPIFIDPDYAVGYTYEIVSGDNLILSAIFPTLPFDTDGYDVYSLDDILLATGVYSYTFQSGVTGFKLLDIDLEAMIDPTDGGAFVTGLVFSNGNTVQVTQTPIVVNVPAAVPEPATWGMMLLGFGLVGGAVRARKTAAVRA